MFRVYRLVSLSYKPQQLKIRLERVWNMKWKLELHRRVGLRFRVQVRVTNIPGPQQ